MTNTCAFRLMPKVVIENLFLIFLQKDLTNFDTILCLGIFVVHRLLSHQIKSVQHITISNIHYSKIRYTAAGGTNIYQFYTMQ